MCRLKHYCSRRKHLIGHFTSWALPICIFTNKFCIVLRLPNRWGLQGNELHSRSSHHDPSWTNSRHSAPHCSPQILPLKTEHRFRTFNSLSLTLGPYLWIQPVSFFNFVCLTVLCSEHISHAPLPGIRLHSRSSPIHRHWSGLPNMEKSKNGKNRT